MLQLEPRVPVVVLCRHLPSGWPPFLEDPSRGAQSRGADLLARLLPASSISTSVSVVSDQNSDEALGDGHAVRSRPRFLSREVPRSTRTHPVIAMASTAWGWAAPPPMSPRLWLRAPGGSDRSGGSSARGAARARRRGVGWGEGAGTQGQPRHSSSCPNIHAVARGGWCLLRTLPPVPGNVCELA